MFICCICYLLYNQCLIILCFFFYVYGDPRDLHVLTHSFPTRRSSDPPALTRADLRRRAQAEAAASIALTRRQVRSRAASESAADAPGTVEQIVAVEQLPALAPEALELPHLPADVAVVVETAAAADQTSPISLPTSPIALPGFHRESVPAEDSVLDEFEAAARLFSFTGETPVQVAANALRAEDAQSLPVPEEPRRGASFRRVAPASFSLGVIGVVGLLTVGMTTPVEAVAVAQGGTPPIPELAPGDVAPAEEDIQAYVTAADVQNAGVERLDNYTTTTIAEMAAESGISHFSNFFVNDPTAALPWPLAVAVPLTSRFGMRVRRLPKRLHFDPGP